MDPDAHAVKPSDNSENIWILDSTFQYIAGNAMQVSGANTDPATCHHIYFGRNTVTQTRQSATSVKKAQDVIISQNTISNSHLVQDGNWSAGLTAQYSPGYVWFIFNTVSDMDHVVKLTSGATPNELDHIFIVGNVGYDIHHDGTGDDDGRGPGSCWMLNANLVSGSQHTYLVNNTCYDADFCAGNQQTGETQEWTNNICSTFTLAGRSIVIVDSASQAAAVTFTNSILHAPETAGNELRWGSASFTTCSTVGGGVDCNSVDPLFVSPGSANFSIQNGSPAKNTGAVSDVYATFESRYGRSIAFDLSGTARPQGGIWDIGAYEFDEAEVGTVRTIPAFLAIQRAN